MTQCEIFSHPPHHVNLAPCSFDLPAPFAANSYGPLAVLPWFPISSPHWVTSPSSTVQPASSTSTSSMRAWWATVLRREKLRRSALQSARCAQRSRPADDGPRHCHHVNGSRWACWRVRQGQCGPESRPSVHAQRRTSGQPIGSASAPWSNVTEPLDVRPGLHPEPWMAAVDCITGQGITGLVPGRSAAVARPGGQWPQSPAKRPESHAEHRSHHRPGEWPWLASVSSRLQLVIGSKVRLVT